MASGTQHLVQSRLNHPFRECVMVFPTLLRLLTGSGGVSVFCLSVGSVPGADVQLAHFYHNPVVL